MTVTATVIQIQQTPTPASTSMENNLDVSSVPCLSLSKIFIVASMKIHWIH